MDKIIEFILWLIRLFTNEKEEKETETKPYHSTEYGTLPTFLWPTDYKQVVTQPFGVNSQWYAPYGVPAHEGIDLALKIGTKVFAVWDGKVSRKENHSTYGNHIRLEHEIDGIRYETAYCHFNEPSHLKVGDIVKRGDVVGLGGSTGRSTGPHLHFHLKQFNGTPPATYKYKRYKWTSKLIDPTPFFKEFINE